MTENLIGIRQEIGVNADSVTNLASTSKELYQPRHVMFGDIPVVENIENRIPDSEFKRYEQRFDLFKSLASSTEDVDEQTFLSSRLVYRSAMGLEPDSGFFPNEARVLYQALDRVDALDKYSVFVDNKYGMEVLFFNLEATESVMLQNRDFFGFEDSIQNLPKEKIDEIVMKTYNQDDIANVIRGEGLLSGFPRESVEFYLETVKDTNPFPIRPLDSQALDYLQSGSPHWDKERLEHVYTRDYIQTEAKNETGEKGDKVGVSGYGTSFVTPHPPSQEVLDYCQKMLEIDRRLGVTEYVDKTRSLIQTRKELLFETDKAKKIR